MPPSRKKAIGKVLGDWLAPAIKAKQQEAVGDAKSDPYQDLAWPAIAYHPDGRLMTRDERVERAHSDRLFFGRCYFPHYFTTPSAEFHLEWFKQQEEMRPAGVPTAQRSGRRKAEACMRGSAKTTIWGQLDTIHGIVYGEEPYTLIIGSNLPSSRQIVRDIRVEFEENELLRADYGNLVPAKGAMAMEPVRVRLKGYQIGATVRKPMWAITSITTITNMKVEAVAAGAALRGRRHGKWRPTKVVIDDLETDKGVQSVLRRDYLEQWVKSAVLKIGDSYTNFIYIDTLKHADSVLNRILKGTGWRGTVRKAIVRWADRQDLWDQWREIYTDKVNYANDEAREAAALQFFEEQKEEMLQGAEVLWPAHPSRTYYALMCLRVDDGEDAFNTEMQQEPVDRQRQFFHPRYFNLIITGGEKQDQRAERDRLPWALWSPEFWANTMGYGALDPSLGRNQSQGKKSSSDFSAILFGAKAIKTGLVYVVVADLQRRVPTRIKSDIFAHVRKFRELGAPANWLKAFGMESVGFQSYFAERTADDSAAEGIYLPVVEVPNTGDKYRRIDEMQPDVENGYYLFSTDQHEMIKQLERYRVDKYHDDGPDTLEMLKRVVTGQIKVPKKPKPVAPPTIIGIKMKR